MDWQHGTMRFELCNERVRPVSTQYNGFNLTWLDIPYYLSEQEVFVGTTSELNKIDRTLCAQLEKNDIQYLACTVIRDSMGYPIGIFGVT
ncbi:MAG: hypothetical protein RRY26_03230 [Cellulosilyticaceae bacterium]